MTRHRRSMDAALLAGCVLVISGCTGGATRPPAYQDSAVKPGSVRLTAFHSCYDALAALREAAKASAGPYGMPGSTVSAAGALPSAAGADQAMAPAAADAASAAGTGVSASAATSAYSGTNDYTAGVDEPDLVKTDGTRVVTVAGGVLQVIDAESRTVTGRLNLAAATGGSAAYQPANLLLSGDHALVLTNAGSVAGGVSPSADGVSQPVTGPQLLLVDLTGQPRVLSSYSIEGSLADARQVGSVVRVVIRSQPRLDFPAQPSGATGAQRVAANRAAIGSAGIDAWLPHYEQATGGSTSTGRVPCAGVSRPAAYSGTNLLTVLTFDLASGTLGSGNGVTIVADGDTVYGTSSSLYVASDQRWQIAPRVAGAGAAVSDGALVPQPQTTIYRFDITQPGPPRFAAGGSVPGYLLDQYAMSEWQGYLRIATTTGTSWAIADGAPPDAQTSSSAVYVLTTRGPVMRTAGKVTGLGVGERIYAVRFIGPAGYVVTFRQTDPLYTLDLRDPARPRVRGALALTGYSAYLHPASDVRLIGIGRQADAVGHVGGTQVSLFDVSDLGTPARLATFALAGAISGAEFDPHAFLYWPSSHLVVVPVQMSGSPVPGGLGQSLPGPQPGALVLRIYDAGITEAGFLSQPDPGYASNPYKSGQIERSLVIGHTLWTVSDAGAMASDLTTLRQLTWILFA
jgi:hypothetical protein